METLNKYAGVLAVVAIVLAIIAFGFPKAAKSVFGGVTNYDEVDATAVKIGGSSGSRVGPVISGTAALVIAGGANNTVAASSTITRDIAITGIVANDPVFVQLGTTTPAATGLNWAILGASASSTSGFATLLIANFTGASAQIPASIGSSTQYLVMHPVTSVPGL